METVFTGIILWVELAFFVLVFLIALPFFARLVVALLNKDAVWPGDKHYAEPKNVSSDQYTAWYLKGDIPLFSGFMLYFLGVLAGAVVSLFAILNTFGLQEVIKTAGWNLVSISYALMILVAFYCAIHLLKILKFVREFFKSGSYRYAQEKRRK